MELQKNKIVLPIKLGIDPMEHLLVADFKGDPEYTCLEPQLFNDSVNGKGIRILRYRKDQKVDVYWQKGVNVDINNILIGAGVGDFAETVMEPACFEITDKGVNVNCAFTDAQNRKVELIIKENTTSPGRFPFLAPVGNCIENPQRLFLVNMLDFDFVRKKGTIAEAKIGDRKLYTKSFPLLRNFKKVLFIRYSALPLVGTLNPYMDSPLIFEAEAPGSTEIDGTTIFIDDTHRITRLSIGENLRKVEMNFFPAYPNLANVSDGESRSGLWNFKMSGTHITGGSYSLSREGNLIKTEIDVTENWKPQGVPISLKIFTRFLSWFRTWPTTYRWRGTIDIANNFSMTGLWERKK